MAKEIKFKLTVEDQGSEKVEQFAETFDHVGKEVAEVSQQLNALNRNVARIEGRLRRFERALSKVREVVLSLKAGIGMLIGAWGLKRLSEGFMEVAKTTENYETRLRVLLGSVHEANRLFRDMAEYASRVPFQYKEVMESAVMLAGVLKGGVEEIEKWIPLIGDLAAASGLSIREATDQFIRMYSAGAQSADLFRERGILAMLGFKAGVSYTAEETRRILWREWTKAGSQFRGATDQLARTWEGTMSMLEDAWFQFRDKVMRSGVFQFLKIGLQTLLNRINRLKAEGRLDEWAKQMAQDIIQAMEGIATGAALVGDSFRGWMEIWDLLKIGFAGLAEFIAEGLERIDRLTEQVPLLGWLNRELGEADRRLIELLDRWELELNRRGKSTWAYAVHLLREFFQLDEELFSRSTETAEELRQFAQKTSEEARKHLASLAEKPLNKDRIKEFFSEVRKQIAEQQESVNETVKSLRRRVQEVKQLTEEELEAYLSMYETLREFGYSDFRYQVQLIERRKQKFIDITHDSVTAERWASLEKRKAWEEDRLRFGTFAEGVRIAYERMKREARSFAEIAYESFRDFVEESRSLLSDLFYDTFTGQLRSLRSYWTEFWNSMVRIFSERLAEITVDWILGIRKMETGRAAATAAKTALAGSPLLGLAGVGLGGLLTAPTVKEASWLFKALSKIPGVRVMPLPKGGVTLGVGGAPLGKILSGAGLALAGGMLLGQILPFQEGGIVVKPTLGMLAERNPEAVIPLKGGKIPIQIEQKPEPTPVQLNITNVVDPSLFRDFLASPQGEDAILNIIARNNYKIRKMIAR